MLDDRLEFSQPGPESGETLIYVVRINSAFRKDARFQGFPLSLHREGLEEPRGRKPELRPRTCQGTGSSGLIEQNTKPKDTDIYLRASSPGTVSKRELQPFMEGYP